MMVSEPITILVADDDPGHCELIRRNLRRVVAGNPVVVVLDFVLGRDATERLMVLMDINMPGATNGVDALRQIKASPATRTLPVFMLTSTDDPREVAGCYALGCNIYLTKPVDPANFIEAIGRLGRMIEIMDVPPFGATEPA